jgi:hypothetical protein
LSFWVSEENTEKAISSITKLCKCSIDYKLVKWEGRGKLYTCSMDGEIIIDLLKEWQQISLPLQGIGTNFCIS